MLGNKFLCSVRFEDSEPEEKELEIIDKYVTGFSCTYLGVDSENNVFKLSSSDLKKIISKPD